MKIPSEFNIFGLKIKTPSKAQILNFFKNPSKPHAFGRIVAGLLVLATLAFMLSLIHISFLPSGLLIIIGIILVAIAAIASFLTWDIRKHIRAIIGSVLAFSILLVEIFGTYYITIGGNALRGITNANAEYAQIGIYVKDDDPAQKLSDTKDYTFGILDNLDRPVTNLAITKFSKKLGVRIKYLGFVNLSELLDALLVTEEVNALIINSSLLELLEESPDYKNDVDSIRELYSLKIKTDSGTNMPNELPEKQKDVFSVYISGIDCRGSVSRRSRSDVNIIATVNTKTGQVLLVSTPRDFYVPLSISDGVPDKLTHAGIYGINVSRETLEMLYDTKIDYYFRLNFDGFEGIVDALGGVTVVSQYRFKTAGIQFEKGENFLNGKEALVFARDRYHMPGGDRQRGRNQMAVITGVINKAMSPALLTNYTDILSSISGTFQTDMPYERISRLIQNQIKDGTKWNVTTYSADGTGASKKPYSSSGKAYVMIPNQTTVDTAKALIKQVKKGEVPVLNAQ